jgi:hypothetical protein
LDALEAEKSEEAELDSFSEHCCKNKRVSADITRSFGIYDMECGHMNEQNNQDRIETLEFMKQNGVGELVLT